MGYGGAYEFQWLSYRCKICGFKCCTSEIYSGDEEQYRVLEDAPEEASIIEIGFLNSKIGAVERQYAYPEVPGDDDDEDEVDQMEKERLVKVYRVKALRRSKNYAISG
jgi:hypothetical protein